jgi:hypothetical protein
MAVILAPVAENQFFANDGTPLAGGQLSTFAGGTSTPLATFTDSTGLVLNSNPIILDAAGRASIWLSGGVAYKFVMKDSGGVTLWTQDNIVVPVLANVSTIAMRKGTGAGDYTNNNTGAYISVDGANLSFPVTIPLGWKLLIQASGTMTSDTAPVPVFVALIDAGSTTLLQEATVTPTVAGVNGAEPFSLSYVFTGDGAVHQFNLVAKTSVGADIWRIRNSSASILPTMTFLLSPSS